ncbi:MAG: hypothetical protein C4289_08315, partial [Chloroflexota bacterium]
MTHVLARLGRRIGTAREVPGKSGTPPMEEPFWDVPLATLLEQLHTTSQGLTATEAQRRLDRYGPNALPRAEPRSLAVELVALLGNPLVLILLAASAVSAALGEAVNAGLIALIVGLSMLLDAVQMYRSQRAAERLRQALA